MKIRKILRVFCCWLVLFSLTSAARAASVTIHSGGEPGVNNLSGSEYISDIVESGGRLYFMVMDRTTGYQTKIICSAVNDEGNAIVYTPGMAASSAQLHFISMEPASSGGLWAYLEDGPELNADRRVVLFRDGQAAAQQKCSGRARLFAEGAIWKDEAQFVCWDGTQLTRYPISAALDKVGGFVLWNGKPCFEDWSDGGRVLACQADGRTAAIFSLPEDARFAGTSLFTCAGELYLSYSTDAGEAHTVRVSDGKQLNDRFYPVDRVRLQPDGTVQLMVTESTANSVTSTQVSISQDAITERAAGEYLVKADVKIDAFGADGLPIGWRFTDSAGNQWIYPGGVNQAGTAPKAAKITTEGTTVSYVSEALSGFALYHHGAVPID